MDRKPPPHRSEPRPGQEPTAALETYPWAREREALEALERLELDRCRSAVEALADDLALPAGADLGPIVLLLSDLLARLRAVLQPRAEGTPAAAASAERTRRALRLGGASDVEALQAALLAELAELFHPLARGASLSPGVLRARAYLDLHFRRRLGLREVAEAVNLSPNYLSALFRKETGTTVTRYLRARRMRLAEQLLVEGRHSISEVAYLVGYQNYRDFHRNFVRDGGRSPRAFQHVCRARRRSLGAARPPSPERD